MRARTAALLALVACHDAQVHTPPPPAQSAVPTVVSPPPAPAREAFIENDYGAALARARAEGKPLFVDAWATWCHTCRAMRAYVLTEEALPRDRFVWLSMDIEKPENEGPCAHLPTAVLPTFFVLDPRDEHVLGRWEGAASSAQMRVFLADAERAMTRGDGGAPDPLLTALAVADRAEAEGRHADAARLLGDVLASAPASWPRRPDALVSRIGALARAKDYGACIDLGLASLGDTGTSSSTTDFATTAVECTEHLEKDPRARSLRAKVAERLAGILPDVEAPLSPDDRSDGYRLLWDVRLRLGDPKGAEDAAKERLRVLEDATTKWKEPAVATLFDGARLETLLFLGRARDAVTFLEAREAELPGDYNVPHRLARALLEDGRPADALAATDRALATAYGPRKGLIYGLRADILVKLGRARDARAAVAAQLELYRSLPPGQRRPALEKAAEDRLARMR